MPSTENGTVRIARERPGAKRPALRVVGEPASPPARQRNAERRPREYLTPAEVDDLKNERLYVQLSSERAPDGNLRGWILH